MKTGLIDTHFHPEAYARRGQLDTVLARAVESGVVEAIAIGTGPEDWPLYRQLTQERPGRLHYTVGIHPCHVEAGWEQALSQLEAYFASATPPVALGEIGLDRFHLPKDDAAAAEEQFARQRAAFASGLEIARRLHCPVVIHSRGAFAECLAMIEAAGVDWAKVVFHCFVEGPAELGQLLERGGRASFTGIVTYKNADLVRASLKAHPLDRLMIETDAPWLSPTPHRGKENEPAFLAHVAHACAHELGLEPEAFAELTTRNARRFFALPG